MPAASHVYRNINVHMTFDSGRSRTIPSRNSHLQTFDPAWVIHSISRFFSINIQIQRICMFQHYPALPVRNGCQRHHMFIETSMCTRNSTPAGVVQSPPVISIYKHLTPLRSFLPFHDSFL